MCCSVPHNLLIYSRGRAVWNRPHSRGLDSKTKKKKATRQGHTERGKGGRTGRRGGLPKCERGKKKPRAAPNRKNKKKKPPLIRALNAIERVGNKLPHPITLFAIFSLLVVVLSALLASLGVSVHDPANPEQMIQVNNLLSVEGIRYLFTSAVGNFTNFAPLGTVLVTMLGIGLAERSGLISALLRSMVIAVPQRLLTAALVFAGIMSSMASDAGYVILTPLGAVLFAGLGRHPLAGLAAAFAGVSGGYSANLLLTSLDPLLGGMSQDAAAIIDPNYAANMNYAMNYYFMFVSVFLITIVGTLVTEKLVEPRLGKYEGGIQGEVIELKPEERKGLWGALIGLILTSIVIALLVIPLSSPLRAGEENIKRMARFLPAISSV